MAPILLTNLVAVTTVGVGVTFATKFKCRLPNSDLISRLQSLRKNSTTIDEGTPSAAGIVQRYTIVVCDKSAMNSRGGHILQSDVTPRRATDKQCAVHAEAENVNPLRNVL